ncbi:ImmA/IrrE family metallo-endopeptidase [Aureibacillus halotolerans]|uniref:Uncharacterized protein DUF955 n=1 Tax=Aureibacillus halotolerans TaxID=1508390 RepID=A0A4R6TZW2_9BACI|nr:ImmA/IrrE family metallo-endopeptidase [Aureibacillus halotolerans]TDQ39191.1 uncharacterized protein DUF955 [Aureibacillus halotolerans]
MKVKKGAQDLIDRFGTSCPFRLAEELGICVVFEDLGNILGYYSKHFRIQIIHINENTYEQQKKFICAHELGHAVLHPHSNTSFLKRQTYYSTDKIESEANAFAVDLLFAKESGDTIMVREMIEDYKIPKHVLNERGYK